MRYILMLLLITGCSQTVEVLTETGVKKITFGFFDIKDTKLIILKEVDLNKKTTQHNSCSYTGFCHGCGIRFDGKQNCGFAIRMCSGHKEVEYKVFEQTYKMQYVTKTGTYESPIYTRESLKHLRELSGCH